MVLVDWKTRNVSVPHGLPGSALYWETLVVEVRIFPQVFAFKNQLEGTSGKRGINLAATVGQVYLDALGY